MSPRLVCERSFSTEVETFGEDVGARILVPPMFSTEVELDNTEARLLTFRSETRAFEGRSGENGGPSLVASVFVMEIEAFVDVSSGRLGFKIEAEVFKDDATTDSGMLLPTTGLGFSRTDARVATPLEAAAPDDLV